MMMGWKKTRTETKDYSRKKERRQSEEREVSAGRKKGINKKRIFQKYLKERKLEEKGILFRREKSWFYEERKTNVWEDTTPSERKKGRPVGMLERKETRRQKKILLKERESIAGRKREKKRLILYIGSTFFPYTNNKLFTICYRLYLTKLILNDFLKLFIT